MVLAVLAMFVPVLFMGCEGDDGAQGPPGVQGEKGPPGQDATAAVVPESCAVCHNDQSFRNGDSHQADYDQRFQDGVVVVTNIAYAYSAADNTHTTTFNMTRGGANFDCTETSTDAPEDALAIGFAEYTAASRSFDPPAPRTTRLSLGTQGTATVASTLSYDLATNLCTSVVAAGAEGDLSLRDGLIVVYGRDDRQGTLPSPSRVQLAIHPFAGILETGTAGVDYASAATVEGCQKCHTIPYLKHGYIYGRVDGDASNDFYTCKACHMDNGNGGHFIWQLLVNDPRLIITLEEELGSKWESSGDPRLAPYAYKTRLMNDVHMSHAMEFAYPQSMANCVACHEGKLASVLTDENFVIETCKSCHPVNGASYPDKDYSDDKRAPALADILPLQGSITAHNPPFATACNGCHKDPLDGGFAPVFSAIHTGYDKVIYGDAAGTKYSDEILVTIDSASWNDNTKQLSFSFSAEGSLGGADSANIVPTVLVGLYGYDTKDFYFGPHDRTIDNTVRDLEAAAGTTHPRLTITSPAAGSWDVTADLTSWAGWIDNGTVKRVEVAATPLLRNADNVAIALNAPSRTFNLVSNAFEDGFFGNSIVKVADGCNTCHEALATTFHTNSPGRGGNIVVCRLCHTTKSPGSHLELQSRSIDSYTHAIHRFQVFDIGDIDFTDPVDELHFQHHVQSNFPRFGIEDCQSCHNPGVFNVPAQDKSMPGALSSADVVPTRNIGTVPSFITGPATRACGACHRAEAIIANAGQGDADMLAAINSHMRTFGYLVEVVSNAGAEVLAVTDEIFLTL